MSRRDGRADSLDGIAIFVGVAQSVSFTEAGRKLGISASGVSRAINRLEERLGVRLVNRTTRSIALTAEGAAYFERCHRILEDLDAAEAAVMDTRVEPRGRLSLQVPRGFGRNVIIPLLKNFLAQYPEITLDVTVNDGAIDPLEAGVEVAMVLGEPRPGRFVARKLCSIGYVVCAAPEYLERHGEPKAPADLAEHRCLNYVRPRTGIYREWTLFKDGKPLPVPVSAALNINDMRAIFDAAIDGAGLAYMMDFLIADAVRDGRLKIVMPDYVTRGVPVYICYPQPRHQSLRVRVFVDYLLRELPPESDWGVDRLIRDLDY